MSTKGNNGTKSVAQAEPKREVAIKPPNMQTVCMKINGVAPYVQARFSAKAIQTMVDKHKAGSLQAGKKTAKPPRDFNADYENAKHTSIEGWVGIPAPAFRNAMISACRLCGFKMTIGKMSVFVEADGFDAVDGIPLVKIIGKPEPFQMYTRNATGVCDIRVRPKWNKWSADVRIRFDADQFTVEDVTNLMMRAGAQVGVGEGRPDSRESNGLGWGLFEIQGAK